MQTVLRTKAEHNLAQSVVQHSAVSRVLSTTTDVGNVIQGTR